MNGLLVHRLQDFIRREQNSSVTVGCVNELEDSLCDGVDIVVVLVIRRWHIFGDVHSGMVLIVKGGGGRAFAYKMFGKTGDSVFLFEKGEISAITHGAGSQNIAD